MKAFQIFYSGYPYINRTEVIVAILDEECRSYELIDDSAKVFKATKGTSKIAIFHLGKYIGYSYRDLVYYLNENGLMLC